MVLVQVPSPLLLILLPVNTPGKATENGPTASVTVTLVGDSDAVLASWPWPGPGVELKHWMEDSVSLSLLDKQVFFLKHHSMGGMDRFLG